MKKPNFIEIRLPGNEKAFAGARGKYLKRLVDRVLEVNFGKVIQRKLFEYLITGSNFSKSWRTSGESKHKFWSLKIELAVPKEKRKGENREDV